MTWTALCRNACLLLLLPILTSCIGVSRYHNGVPAVSHHDSTRPEWLQDFDFETKYSSRDFRTCPIWKESVMFPPLSPRKALAIADNHVRMAGVNPERIELTSISLCPLDRGHWYYLVEYWPHEFLSVDGLPSKAPVVVLMNGRVVTTIRKTSDPYYPSPYSSTGSDSMKDRTSSKKTRQ